MEDHFRYYRRRLPHWREDGATYFVTWRLAPHQPPLAPPERAVIAADFQRYDQRRYLLHAYVVMDDHVHLLFDPMAGEVLEAIVHSWKSFTAHLLQRRHHRHGQILQDEYFDRIVRDQNEFRQKFAYILKNPW